MAHGKPIATTRSATGIPTGKLAVWWVIASEIVIFGGLLVSYLLLRVRYWDEWGEAAAHTNVWCGLINTIVLLTSSLFIVLAHHAAEHNDTKKAFRYIWYTIAGGAIFLCVKGWEWNNEISHGYTITANTFWSFYYVACGLHGLHVIGGMVIMGIISFQARAGKELHRVELIGIYWHFVDVVWIFLFPLMYLANQ